jgi:uncharacterized membrane protein YbhN (UPF0104 family)
MSDSRNTDRGGSSLKRLGVIFAKTAVSGALIWYLVSSIDLAESAERLAQFDAGWGVLALAVLALAFVVGALRWRVFARRLNIALTIGAALRLSLIGQFFGQVLPAGVGGDAVRAWLLVRRGADVGPSVGSIVLDRLAGLAALLFMIALSLPETLTLVDDANTRWGLGLLLVIGVAGIAILFGLSYLPHAIARWRRVRILADTIREARRAGLSPRPASSAVGLSLFGHVLSVLTVFLIAKGLGLTIAPLACLVLVPPVMLVAILPISVAGWGVREGAMVAALGFAGIAAGDALAISILFGLGVLAISLTGSVLWLAQGRETRRKLFGARLAEQPRTEIATP